MVACFTSDLVLLQASMAVTVCIHYYLVFSTISYYNHDSVDSRLHCPTVCMFRHLLDTNLLTPSQSGFTRIEYGDVCISNVT